jgi:hypothetical protein
MHSETGTPHFAAAAWHSFAPANSAYVNPISHMQATGGSTSIRAFYGPLRQVELSRTALCANHAAAKLPLPVNVCQCAVILALAARMADAAVGGTACHEPSHQVV